MLHQEEVAYVGEGLASILGRQRLATSGSGSLLAHPQAQLGGITYTVDEGLLLGEAPPSGNGSSTEDLVEHLQAFEVFAEEPS